jgi:hypothetical protein
MWIHRVLSDDIKSVPVVVDDIRARVSKWITVGSKAFLMDVIGFLCASLGSSKVQLHDSLGSRCACACSEAHFSSQNGDRARVYYRRAAFYCVFFFWAKGLGAKDIHTEMFPVYGEKCLSHKAVHNWLEKFSQGCSAVAGDDLSYAEVAETTVKRLLCCRFRHTDKATGQVYHCWWRICMSSWPICWLSLV